MGYINISDGSVTPTPPSSPPEDGADPYAADEQFANVYWQWDKGDWHQLSCPAGLIYNPHLTPGPVCVWPQDYLTSAPYVLDDPSLA